MLRCGDGSLYTGITTDLSKRLKAHTTGKGAAYTRSHLPLQLAWQEVACSESIARRREAQIKRLTRQEKLLLISSTP